jgi:deoxyribodipyrimidine photo-lyase
MTKKIIIWLKNDLRIRDNELLFRAGEKGLVYPVYCFDPRQFEENELRLPKKGPFRADFLRMSVANLRKNLKKIGSDLLIRQGLPEKIIPQLVTLLQASAVYTTKEITQEELFVESALEKSLLKLSIPLEFFWQSTLLHVDDIPWPK